MLGILVFLFLFTRRGGVIRMMGELILWDFVQAHVSKFARFN